MSGVNPLAGAAAAAAAVEAAVAAELQALAADAQALRALLTQGDVVQATVLPFNGLTDLIEVYGMRVAAALPSNVFPGDTLSLEVQGFSGDKILVKVLSDQPAEGGLPRQLPAPASDTFVITQTPVPFVSQETLPPPSAEPLPGPVPSPADEGVPLAQTPSTQTPVPAPAQAPAPPAAPPLAASRAPAPPPTARPATAPLHIPTQVRPVPTEPETLTVEARLAFTRGATPPVRNAPPTPAAQRGTTPAPPPGVRNAAPPAQQTQPGRAPQAAQNANLRTPQPLLRSAVAPQAYIPITPRPAVKPPPAPLPGAPVPMRGPGIIPAGPAVQPRLVAAVPSALLGDPTALLRTLRIPVTPTTLTFAKLVTQKPEQVATALRALEQSLPDTGDPRIQTLRTLAAFVGTLDPKSPTFTTQVTSYLAHVVEGPEPKLLSLVARAEPEITPQAASESAPTPQLPSPQSETSASATPAQPAAAQPAAQASPPAQPPAVADSSSTAAQVVERTSAASTDLKTQLLGILAASSALGDAGAAVAQNALTAVVTSQLSSLAAQQLHPGTFAFTIPVVIDQQVYPARVQVDRDKPGGGKEPLTGDDFHIAFILDTPRFGMVAVDLRAVGRAVTVAVKTEREAAAASFKSALAQLGDRLASLKYNVKSLDAEVKT